MKSNKNEKKTKKHLFYLFSCNTIIHCDGPFSARWTVSEEASICRTDEKDTEIEQNAGYLALGGWKEESTRTHFAFAVSVDWYYKKLIFSHDSETLPVFQQVGNKYGPWTFYRQWYVILILEMRFCLLYSDKSREKSIGQQSL